MAIDTENKRRSALGKHVLPSPDGTIDQADRQHKVWKYAGILATLGVVVAQRFDLIGSEDRNRNLIGSDNSLLEIIGSEDRKRNLVGA